MTEEKVTRWQKGKGKMGALEPLLGSWYAETETSMGLVGCTRTFTRILSGRGVRLEAIWRLPDRTTYEEEAIFVPRSGGQIGFWSFTSDGKRSEGSEVDASEVHPDAVAFEAEMPAGRARMVYWPGEDGGLQWAVESKNKKGWKRFTHHRYRRL